MEPYLEHRHHVSIVPINLPVQVTSFVGRVLEIVEAKRLLAGTRLLTLTGAGGCGKTRLALRVAADLLETYPDGVWWAELAPLADAGVVPRAVAAALGVPEPPGRALSDSLSDFLRSKNLLLVLDNCEHLIASCAALADTLLHASPTIRIMATSREALGLGGELTYRVPSLTLPDPRRLPAASRLLDYEAIRLFADRAAFSDPRFEIMSNNAAAVAQICARLDGMPLALELAAARVKVLAVEQIAKRLDDRFQLLTGGSRAALPRHQTLRAALDWSYGLLSDAEQLMLGRVSTFAGGWTLDAAEAVCAGDGVEAYRVLDVLTQLVDKSLVQMEASGGEARYRLFETVRQYGQDRLRESDAEERFIRRHRDFFLDFAEIASPHLTGPDSTAWLNALDREHDNLRAAYARSRDTGDVAGAARLEIALERFFMNRGYHKEGWEWFGELLARAGELPALLGAHLRATGASLAFSVGRYGDGAALGGEALASVRSLSDTRDVARCSYRLGIVTMAMGDHAQAAEYLEESMRLYRDLGDDVLYAEALRHRGHIESRRGDYPRATAMLEDAFIRLRNGGYRRGAAYAQRHLALVKLYEHDFAGAAALLNAAFVEFEELGDREGMAYTLSAWGSVWRRQGDLERAAASYREGLVRAREVGLNWGIVECLYGLGAVHAARKRPADGARLFGAAVKLCEAISLALPQAEQIEYDGVAAAMRRALGEKAYTAAVAEGRALPLDRAVEQALASVQDAQAATTWPAAAMVERVPGRAPGARQRPLLTSREREVAALVAQGLTNREIASRLVITEKTVDAHVQHILNKLGAHSRTQIALWAAEQGMDGGSSR